MFWPHFLVLVVLYWSTMAPRAGGILLGFLAGLCLDVFNGSQLGQHALALSLLAYLAIRLHLLTRAKPIFEQSVLALVALFVYEGVLWAVDGWSGQRISSWTRWVPVAHQRPGVAADRRPAGPPAPAAIGSESWPAQYASRTCTRNCACSRAAASSPPRPSRCSACCCIGRLVLLQIVRYDYYLDLSQGNRARLEPIPANRGLILDRNGDVLAENQPSYQLELVREQVPDLEQTLNALVSIGLIPPKNSMTCAG